ncbi:hypothetical protein TNCV_551281 [Trichonephila clavipes]|nr:hypothetical protein TNCV_551281 [Trichonephila clavipes]
MNGRTRLHVVANGTMTGQRYIDEVLLFHVRLFRGAVGDKFVFMDDNATCHRTLAVQNCLDSEGIQRLVWPARSPDLNPINCPAVYNVHGHEIVPRVAEFWVRELMSLKTYYAEKLIEVKSVVAQCPQCEVV